MYCHIKDLADKGKLQKRIDNFVKRTNKWQVSLNINKCKIMSIHHRKHSNMGVGLKNITKIKDR